MPPLGSIHPVLGHPSAAADVLAVWRAQGPEAARLRQYQLQQRNPGLACDRLQRELLLRLSGGSGPRLLIDGVWFCRPHGGITRVWEQILQCWQLPGMATEAAPIALIDRDSHLACTARFPSLEAAPLDPLDAEAVAAAAEQNADLVRRWRAEVFLSSWISSSAPQAPACDELALVHDCLPERFDAPAPLQRLRRRWLQGARAHLAVSADTAADLETLLSLEPGRISWCHSALPKGFADHVGTTAATRRWRKLRSKAGIDQPFVLLPATSAIGSYKNPELLACALAAPALAGVQLVLCGIAADQRRQELEQQFPHLEGRCQACGFSDWDLALAYQHAMAVVIPSHAEGFGLPAIEAMGCGATVLVADSRGLREAGGVAALRFQSRRPNELADLLTLVLPPVDPWLQTGLEQRRRRRLAALHPDLLGLALLALARALHG